MTLCGSVDRGSELLLHGTYPAERILVFSSVILQRNRSVGKGCDIRCLLDCCLALYLDGQFDVLLQEAQHCDRSLRNSYRSSAPHSDNHLAKVFTKWHDFITNN